jgi:hypothetical protein
MINIKIYIIKPNVIIISNEISIINKLINIIEILFKNLYYQTIFNFLSDTGKEGSRTLKDLLSK